METDPVLPALPILYEKALPRYDSLETICRALSTSAQRGCIELEEAHTCLTRYPPHQKRSEELVPGNPQVRASLLVRSVSCETCMNLLQLNTASRSEEHTTALP